jgi:acetyl esterase/lipase
MATAHEGPLNDVRQALALLRQRSAEWNLDPARLGVLGFSAGGHLAASALTLLGPDRPAFGGLIYPVISMRTGITHDGSRDNLLGPNPAEELVDHYSLELQVDASTPPTFLAHAADDGAVPVQNSLLFHQAMIAHGVRGELHVYERGGHGFGIRGKGTEGGWMDAFNAWASGVFA